MNATADTTNRLASLLTTAHLARLFRVSRVAVNKWRLSGCPHVLIPGDKRDTPRYVLFDVVAWRESRGLKIPASVRSRLARSAPLPAPADTRRGPPAHRS